MWKYLCSVAYYAAFTVIGVCGCASDGDPVLSTSMMPTKLLGTVPPQDEPNLGEVYGDLPDRRESERVAEADE